jgi:hypothetical protein
MKGYGGPGQPSPLRWPQRDTWDSGADNDPAGSESALVARLRDGYVVIGRRFRILTVVDDFTRNAWVWSWTPRSPLCA